MTERDRIVDEAFNLAIAHIQTALGQDAGDFAALYFDGDKEDAALSILNAYYDAEEAFMKTEPTPAARLEMALLEALAESDARTFAMEDLEKTPKAAYRADFMGEHFYGATAIEALNKVEEFARDAGKDTQAALANAGGATLTTLRTTA